MAPDAASSSSAPLTSADAELDQTASAADFAPVANTPGLYSRPLSFLGFATLCANLALLPIPPTSYVSTLSRPAILSSRRKLSIRSALLTYLRAALSTERVDQGYNHSADNALLQAFVADPREAATALNEFFQESVSIQTADMLRLVGRIPLSVVNKADVSWRYDLIAKALKSSRLGIREAAIETVENWADPLSLGLLKAHNERTPWLQQYARQVLKDASKSKAP